MLYDNILQGGVFGFRFDNIPSFAIGAIWFLKSLFICYLIYFTTSKCGRFKYWALGLSLVVCLTVPHIYFQLDIMYPCFLFGIFINKRYDYIRCHLRLLFIVSISVFALSISTNVQSIMPDSFSSEIGYIFKGIRYYSNKLWTISAGFSGSLIWITLFMMSENWISSTKIGRLMCRCGTMTLGIYVLQTLVIEIVLREIICLDSVNQLLFSLIIAPVISLFVMILCIALIEIIRKNKVTTLMILGEKK